MTRVRFSLGTRKVAGVLLLLAGLPACYTYQIADPMEVTPGEEVQLVLSGPATRGAAPSALIGETLVEGNLVGVSDDSISVSVWIGQAYRGTPFEPVRQAYAFPRMELVRLERKQLSKPRTALTAVGILVGIYVLIDRIAFWEDPNPPGGGDVPDPPASPAILWSWPFISGSRQ